MAFVAAVLLPLSVRAQVGDGDRVRVRASPDSSWHSGWVASFDAGTLQLTSAGEVRTFTIAEIDSLQVSVGTHSLGNWGMLIGGGVGLVEGLSASDRICDGGTLCFVGTTMLYSAISAGLGALIGSVIRRDNWSGVPLENLEPG